MRKIILTTLVLTLIFSLFSGCVQQTNTLEISEKPTEPTTIPTPELTPEEIEAWALGCSAILATRNGYDPYQFGMLEKNDYSISIAQELLSSLDCYSREDLIDIIGNMTDNGHIKEFADDLKESGDINSLAKKISDKWGDKQIKAFNWFRMIHFAGWGYIAGYFTLEEAYDHMTPSIERLHSAFSSWDEAVDNYLDGYAWLEHIDVSLPDTEYQYRLQTYKELKGNQVLFNPTVWTSEFQSAGPFNYTDNGDGTCTITNYIGLGSGNLDILEEISGLKVTEIGDSAFSGCNGFTGTLTIPENVTIIGEGAFSGCWGLTGTLTIPESVTTIGNSAFAYCENLTDIIIPEGVTEIGDYAFSVSDRLKNIRIPASVTKIGERAFDTAVEVSKQNKHYSSQGGVLFNKDKSELIMMPSGLSANRYTIPNSVITIGKYAFTGCESLKSITIPNSVTTIGESAFSDCGLKSITIPSSVKTIGDGVFSFCRDLEKVTIQNGITTISENTFYKCENLRSITIPASVTKMERGVFRTGGEISAGALTSINVSKENKNYSSVGGILFNKDKSVLIKVPEGMNKKNYAIPSGVKTIGEESFDFCIGLTGTLTIPASVTTIEGDAFSSGGADGYGFNKAEFLGDAPANCGENAFGVIDDFKIIYNPKKKGWSTPEWNGYPAYPKTYSFRTKDGFEYADRGDSTCSIIRPTDEINGNFKVPEKINGLRVTAIGPGAFSGCESLTSITIPDSVTYIGSSTFNYSSNLASIEVSEQNKNYSSIDGVLFNKEKNELIKMPEGIKKEGYSIPSSVTTIGENAFSGCGSLTSITIPSSVTTIKDGAFNWCRSLTQAEFLGDAPPNFGEYVFEDWEDDFKIMYNPSKKGWSTPEWNGYPAYPKSN